MHPRSAGKYGPLPVFNGTETLACEWQSWSMMLPQGMELEAMDVIYQQVWLTVALRCVLAQCQAGGRAVELGGDVVAATCPLSAAVDCCEWGRACVGSLGACEWRCQ